MLTLAELSDLWSEKSRYLLKFVIDEKEFWQFSTIIDPDLLDIYQDEAQAFVNHH